MGTNKFDVNYLSVLISEGHRSPLKLFTGPPDMDVDDWLDDYEKMAIRIGWDDTNKFLRIAGYLDGNVYHWLKMLVSSKLNVPPPDNWSSFKGHLQAAFPAKLLRNDQIFNVSQEFEEDSIAFCARVLGMCRKVNKSLSECITICLSGLSPNILNEMETDNIVTYDQLCSRVREAEKSGLSKARAHHSKRKAVIFDNN